MKRTRLDQWTVWLLYVSFALVYTVPLVACGSTGICDPTIDGNYLSVSKVIRQTYWNTSFAFVSALFIASSTHVLLSATKSRYAHALCICAAVCAIVPSIIPLDSTERWDTVDVVHSAGAVGAAFFQGLFVVWTLRQEEFCYKRYRATLWLNAAALGGSFVLLVATTVLKPMETKSRTFTACGYFVAEYVISVALLGILRVIILAASTSQAPTHAWK
jgi:NADH:ubiquinone oxidoreductase subunit 6 (subunit J)